jgi:hypothetical protein
MNHATLKLVAAVVAAGLMGFGSPLAADAMGGTHHGHHDRMHFRHHHNRHDSCEYRYRYHGMYGYRHHCAPYHHLGYGYMFY